MEERWLRVSPSKEDLYEKRMARIEAGEGSVGSDLPDVVADADGSVSIEIKERDESLRTSYSSNEWLNSIMDEGDGYQGKMSQKPKIQRVQPKLRDIQSNRRCYDPRVVSIGPCHHGKLELAALERLKIPLAREYVRNSEGKIDELYEEVVKVAGDARKCYAEGLTERFSDEEFTHIMFLDGCFLLQYIYSIAEGKHEGLELIHQAPMVRRDLFLLENQLPFLVLKVLMRLMFGIGQGEKMITAFIMSIRGERPEGVALKEQVKNLFGEYAWRSKGHPEVELEERKDQIEPAHLLELVRRQFINPNAFNTGCYVSSGWYCRRSAKDFKTVGIFFKPSKTYQLTEIEFHRTFGTFGCLVLPKIIVDDTTKSMLLNLAAYEACPDNDSDFGVTSYICFMDSIIDDAEDVKELEYNGILLNFLGSDQQVADLFNQTATELAPSPRLYVYVMAKIEEYHHHKGRTRIATWVAELMRDYFNSPWASIAVFVALFAISLSMVQTYFTIFPLPDMCQDSICQYLKNNTIKGNGG